MFTIIGGDGREYGPVTADQVRAWITAGRANLETKAKALGSEEWRRLGDYAEFGATVTGEPPVMPPAEPAAAVPVFPDVPAAPAIRLASHGARLGAACINAMFYFLSLVPGSIIGGLKIVRDHPDIMRGRILRPDQLDPQIIVQIVVWVYGGLALAVLLQALLIAWRGQNLGKLAVGVRVVRLDGSPAGFLHGALLRFLLPVALFMVLLVFLFPLAFLFLFVDLGFMFSEPRRCLHDLIAGTIVVEK